MKNLKLIGFLLFSLFCCIPVFMRCLKIDNYNDLWILNVIIIGFASLLTNKENGKETKSN